MYYADRIYQINLAIAGIAIGIVILPNLSKYVKVKNYSKINFIQNKSLELSFFLSLPAAICLLIGSKEITSALFGYGSFDEQSVNNSALALFYFSIGLPAFSMIKIFSSFLFARDNTKIPFYFSLVSVIINITISLSLFNEVGFIIIPIATSFSSWVNAIILFVYIYNKKYFSFRAGAFSLYLRMLLSSILSSVLFFNLIKFFNNYLVYESDYKLLFVIILVLLTFVIYILISMITKAFNKSDIKLKY